MTNNREFNNSNLTKYALFAGGLNATKSSLANYDPLVTGYGRLFMIRKPVYLDTYFGNGSELTTFKHILEYGNTGVSGINGIEADFDSITGGYTGQQIEIPTSTKDSTNSFTVKVYEFTGSPVRKVLHTWITGVSDRMSGLATYHGVDLEVLQANHTAEFIYVATDRTGTQVEYACMFANCFPKRADESYFDYSAGDHNLAQLDIEFSCIKYESIKINQYAKLLLDKYKLLSNHLNFNPNLEDVFKDWDKVTPTVVGETSTAPVNTSTGSAQA